MHLKNITAALALTLLAAAPGAMALNTRSVNRTTSQANRGAERFARLDRDGNGVITRNEWPGDQSRFDRLDLNRDGAIAPAEMQQAFSQRDTNSSRFRGMDRDGNGVITRDEWRGNDKSFEKQDRNGDGVISAADHPGKGKAKGKFKEKGHDRDERNDD